MRNILFALSLLLLPLLGGCSGEVNMPSMSLGVQNKVSIAHADAWGNQVVASDTTTAALNLGDQYPGITPMSQMEADDHRCQMYQEQGNWQQLQTCRRNFVENYTYGYNGPSGYGYSGYNQQLQYQQQLYQQQLMQRQAYMQQQMLMRQQMGYGYMGP